MIILLYGQDTYRLKQKTGEIIGHYQKTHKSGLNLRYFDGGKLDFQDFQGEFRSISMFGEKKLIVLKNASSNKDFTSNFLKGAKNYARSENTVLFSEEAEIPAGAFLNSLKKHGKCQEFRLLTGLKLKSWVKKEFAKHQAEINNEALDNLTTFVGNNLWQMSNEIKKLASYKAGRIIEAKDVELLVRPKIDTDIFKTIDAIALRDKKRAISLLYKHLEKGDSHLYLLAMIGFQFRNLLAIKSGSKLRMHPYVVKKTTWQAQAFSFEELKKIYQKIFQADLDIKTGKVDPETALDLLIAEI